MYEEKCDKYTTVFFYSLFYSCQVDVDVFHFSQCECAIKERHLFLMEFYVME